MRNLSLIRLSIALFAGGLLATSVMVNLLGFLSPIAAANFGSDPRHLLSIGQMLYPWGSIFFAGACLALARVSSSWSGRSFWLIGSVIVIASYAVPQMLSGGERQVAFMAAEVAQLLMLLVGAIYIWRRLASARAES